MRGADLLAQKTVLVVDDEPDIRMVARLELADWGLSVTEARSGEEALEVLGESQPDAVLLDLRMPGMGGMGLLERLAAMGRLADVPVVIFSAHLDEATLARASDLGCRGFLPKPFRTDQLRGALEFLTAQ